MEKFIIDFDECASQYMPFPTAAEEKKKKREEEIYANRAKTRC